MTGGLSALASFLFLFLSGYPISCLLLRDERRLRLVLAPLVGLCLDAILLYSLGFYADLPVRTSAVILLAAVAALNIFAIVRDRGYTRVSGAEAGPLAAGLVYLILLAAPLFIVGRGYMSVWNEDCYGYVAVADHLKDHTVRQQIDPVLARTQPVFERVDTIVRRHFQEGFYRIGPEYQLAFVSVVLNGEVRELFFPVLISFAMLMPLGLFLFLDVFGVPRRLALAAVFLLPLLSFHYFGFIAQMLAQAAGIPVVLLCYWALRRAFRSARNGRDLILLSISLAGAMLLYIEAAVLLVPAALYAGLQWVRRRRRFAEDARTAAVVLLILAAFFNVKFPSLVRYEIAQSHPERLFAPAGGEDPGRPLLFPYFLVETGLPTAWGLVTAPLSAWPFRGASPAILWSVMILAVLLITFCAYGILSFPYERRALWGLVAGWFAAAAGLAFLARMDHLLFKLVLWHQFFLWAALLTGMAAVLAAGRRHPASRPALGVALAVLFFFNAVNVFVLGRASLGESAVWVEWRGASRSDPLRRLEAAKSSLSPGEPLTAVLSDFHPARWASYVLKDYPVRFLVNNSRMHFRSLYEGGAVENGWGTRRLLLTSADEDIFKNPIPDRAVVRDAGYYRIVDAPDVVDYVLPVSTGAGIIRQANPEIAAVVGWYPYEIYPESPWFFDRRGFRWVENNSAFLIKNVSGRPLRIKIALEIAPGVEHVPMRVEFGGRTVWQASEMSGMNRILSEPFRPGRDGLGRIVFAGAGTKIDPDRPLRLVNKDIGSDDRIVNARIGRLETVPEAETEGAGFIFGGSRFGPADLDNDHFYFSGLYPDGWASPSVGFVLDLKDKRAFRYRIAVPVLRSPEGFVLSVRIDGTPAGRLAIRAPGPAVLEVPITPEFRKVVRIEISADRSWPIGAEDRRRAVYLFREGELLGRRP